MARVVLKNLSKYFGAVCAVNDLNLEIEDGKFVTVLGPSGCGKSTTLYCIAGLEEPSSGDIFFDDRCVNDLEPRERDVAMVFQDYALYPHMSVYDNISFSLRVQGAPQGERNQRVEKVAEMLGIGGLLQRRPAELSGGQRQRVALGRAIVRSPVVFLMDEPLSNLDAALRVRTRTEIKNLQRELGVTTIFVTHDQEEAMVLSDKIAIMRDGVLQQYDPPMEVYRNPANLYVAGFIGSPAMNFVAGTLEWTDGQAVFAAETFRAPFPPGVLRGPAARWSGARPALLGIRPEGLELHPTAIGGDVPAEVFLVEPIGSVTHVDVRSGGVVLKASVEPSLPVNPGDRVGLSFPAGKIYFFDPDTGAVL
jgi:multiple sugar transport system ATP-binding protein